MTNGSYSNDFEVVDVEDYSAPKEEGFSHQQQVNKALMKCLELGAKEMRAGWFQSKQDKEGNITRTYIEDTRLSFIEAVKTLKNITICDFDEEAHNKILKIVKDISEEKNKFIDMEKEEWNRLKPIIKQRLSQSGVGFLQGKLNKEKSFYQDFINYQVDKYRDMLEEIVRLTERLGFYKVEGLIAGVDGLRNG